MSPNFLGRFRRTKLFFGAFIVILCAAAVLRKSLQYSRTIWPPSVDSSELQPSDGVCSFLLPDVDWPEPTLQRSDGAWIYELFTPPTVELRDGQFYAEEAKVATLSLLRLEEIPNRLSLEGFLWGKDGTLSLFVRDEETGELHFVADGSRSEAGDFSVERCDFHVAAEADEIVRNVTAQDGRDGRPCTLSLGRSIPSGKFSVEVLSDRYGHRECHSLSHIGETFQSNEAHYEFVGAEPERGTIHLRRSGDDPNHTIQLKLCAAEPIEITAEE
jgi:hypothetical protein